MPTLRRPHSVRPLVTLAGLAGLAVLAGCSAGSSAGPSAGSPVASSPASSSLASSSAASSSPAAETSPETSSPGQTSTSGTTSTQAAEAKGEATCTALTATRVGKLLRTSVESGIPDRRTDTEGQRQLDGCSYTGAGEVQLSYLVWQVSVAGDRTLVEQGLPPATTGVKKFKPGLGAFSAGAVVTTGPVATAQVNAVQRRRLVQVSATAGTPSVARSAAQAVAAALIDR